MIDWNLVQTALAIVLFVVIVWYMLTFLLKPPTILAFTIIWLLITGSVMASHGFSVASMALELTPHLSEVLTVFVVATLIAGAVLASGSLGLVLLAFLAAMGRGVYVASYDQALLSVIYLGAFILVAGAYEIAYRRKESSYDFKSELEKMRAMIEAEETKERQRR